MASTGSLSLPTRSSCSSGELGIASPANRFMKHLVRVHNDVSVEELRFVVNEVNWEQRTVIAHITGNVISERYKMVKATLTTIPRGDMTPSRVAWTVEFEKIGNDIQDREQIIGTLTNLIEKIDWNLYQKDNTFDSMYVDSTAVECFKAIHEAFKDDADVEIKAEDWDNKTITLSLRSTHVLMTNFKMIKVTATVTPDPEDEDGSFVQWVLELDNGGFISCLDFPDILGMMTDKLEK